MFSYFSNHFYFALSHSHNPLYIIADRNWSKKGPIQKAATCFLSRQCEYDNWTLLRAFRIWLDTNRSKRQKDQTGEGIKEKIFLIRNTQINHVNSNRRYSDLGEFSNLMQLLWSKVQTRDHHM